MHLLVHVYVHSHTCVLVCLSLSFFVLCWNQGLCHERVFSTPAGMWEKPNLLLIISAVQWCSEVVRFVDYITSEVVAFCWLYQQCSSAVKRCVFPLIMAILAHKEIRLILPVWWGVCVLPCMSAIVFVHMVDLLCSSERGSSRSCGSCFLLGCLSKSEQWDVFFANVYLNCNEAEATHALISANTRCSSNHLLIFWLLAAAHM